jgi:SRSO17 transposase
MSEYLGAETPYQMQQFIYRGRYSAEVIMDITGEYVVDSIGEEEGIMVLDETGFLKQGDKSCGVQRQYSGTAGKVENCQIGVFLTYASSKGHSPIDRRLYMPEGWMTDPERLKAAGVPNWVKFQTKPEMGVGMLEKATLFGYPYKWVTGDSVYGDSPKLRGWLEENGKWYVMGVTSNETIWVDNKQTTILKAMQSIPEDKWTKVSSGAGSKGPREYEWASMEVALDWREIVRREETDEWKRELLVRRGESGEMRAYMCYAPREASEGELIRVAGVRWTVETDFKEAKNEVGMDQYEFRSWDGWHRHVTLACAALALLTVVSASSFDGLPMQAHDPSTSSLHDFKKNVVCASEQARCPQVFPLCLLLFRQGFLRAHGALDCLA